jgi:hypothetical protein
LPIAKKNSINSNLKLLIEKQLELELSLQRPGYRSGWRALTSRFSCAMLKKVGACGQLSLGTKFAGQLYDPVFHQDRRVELLPVKVVPAEPQVREDLAIWTERFNQRLRWPVNPYASIPWAASFFYVNELRTGSASVFKTKVPAVHMGDAQLAIDSIATRRPEVSLNSPSRHPAAWPCPA